MIALLPLTPEELRELAFHEAGHAIVAAAFRCAIASATICPNGNGDDGRVEYAPRTCPPLAPEQYVAITCGGILAGWIAGRRGDCEILAGDFPAMERFKWHEFQVGACLAHRLVRQNWSAIRRIARLLMRDSTVSGHVITQEFCKRKQRTSKWTSRHFGR